MDKDNLMYESKTVKNAFIEQKMYQYGTSLQKQGKKINFHEIFCEEKAQKCLSWPCSLFIVSVAPRAFEMSLQSPIMIIQ